MPCPKCKEVILHGLCEIVPHASIQFLTSRHNTSSGGVVSTKYNAKEIQSRNSFSYLKSRYNSNGADPAGYVDPVRGEKEKKPRKPTKEKKNIKYSGNVLT